MTILGNHTVAETRDMMKVVQYRFDKVEDFYKGIPESWRAEHPDDARLLDLEWANEKKHWADTRDSTSNRLIWLNTSSPLPADAIASEEEYKTILGFVEYGASSGVERKPNDLRSLQERMEKIRGQQVDLQGRPDISKTGDRDMQALAKLDASIAAGKAAAEAARKGAGEAAKSNAGLLIAGGAIGALVLVGLAKFYLPRL